MGGTAADLTSTLGKSIANFNNHDQVAVKTLLTDDVIVHSIKPKKTLIGPFGVASIVHQFKDDPTFTLLHADIDLHGAADGAATSATITGTAKWKDDNGPETLQFTFECVFDSGRGWLFRELSAVTV